MTQLATLFFGLAVIGTTALNLAFTLAPQAMTHLLQAMIA